MTDTPTTYTAETLNARVRALIEEMRSRCEHLDRLSVEQGASLRNGEVEAVLDVLRRREPVLSALAEAGDQVGVILEREDCVAMLGAANFKNARQDLLDLEQLADTIRERDAENHKLMLEQRAGLASRLGSMGQKRNAMNAYGVGKATPNPMIQDRRG